MSAATLPFRPPDPDVKTPDALTGATGAEFQYDLASELVWVRYTFGSFLAIEESI